MIDIQCVMCRNANLGTQGRQLTSLIWQVSGQLILGELGNTRWSILSHNNKHKSIHLYQVIYIYDVRAQRPIFVFIGGY